MTELDFYSIIAPAKDEEGNIRDFVEKCVVGIEKAAAKGEIIIIDDGSRDSTRKEIEKAVRKYPSVVKGFSHRKNEGLTKALKTGFLNAAGDYLLWISPDLEADPSEVIPAFAAKFRQGAEVVAGYRKNRDDGKSLASWVYNKTIDLLFRFEAKDKNWIKGFHRKCLPFISFRSDWHRFILVMLHQAGFRLVQVETSWSKRSYGRSKFGLSRFPKAFIDAVSIWFITVFSQRPMRFFGFSGVSIMLTGGFVHVFLIVYYLMTRTQIRPLFWGAIGAEIIGVLFVLFGFIAELIVRVEDKIADLEISRLKPLTWWEEIH